MNNDNNNRHQGYAFVVVLAGRTILDGRRREGNRHLCWSEDCSDCVPYERLPNTPLGNDPYTSADLCSGDTAGDEEDAAGLSGASTYWPTLDDYLNQTNGIPGVVTVQEQERIVKFVYG